MRGDFQKFDELTWNDPDDNRMEHKFSEKNEEMDGADLHTFHIKRA